MRRGFLRSPAGNTAEHIFIWWPPHRYLVATRYYLAGSILSVESNQNVESKTEKCGVQNSTFTSRNQLF